MRPNKARFGISTRWGAVSGGDGTEGSRKPWGVEDGSCEAWCRLRFPGRGRNDGFALGPLWHMFGARAVDVAQDMIGQALARALLGEA